MEVRKLGRPEPFPSLIPAKGSCGDLIIGEDKKRGKIIRRVKKSKLLNRER